MADQKALDDYRGQIRQDTWDSVTGVLRAPEFNLGGLHGEVQKLPFLKVVRFNGVDFAYGPGVFIRIPSPDYYFLLKVAGFINTPHDEAPVVDQTLIEFIYSISQRTAAPGVALDLPHTSDDGLVVTSPFADINAKLDTLLAEKKS